MRSDGCLIHMGRKDFQIKIRGNRIETSEIENALLQMDELQAAVVHTQADQTGEERLVAYVVARPGARPDTGELQHALGRRLPQYMIPSAFVFLDKLPVVPNGRIDRRALPVPNRVRPALAYDYTEPRTAVESYLANLWAEVLNLEQVGIHDQFLHLGGHSLLATKIISRVAQNFGVKLPVRSLFQTTTIAKLALLIARTQVVAGEPTRCLICLPNWKHFRTKKPERSLAASMGPIMIETTLDGPQLAPEQGSIQAQCFRSVERLDRVPER